MPERLHRRWSIVALPILCGGWHTAIAQRGFAAPEIETIQVAESIYMLVGSGGNSGLSVGADGPVLIDSQYASMSDGILAAIAELSDTDLRIIINTHWHSDHTGSNGNLSRTGAIIIGHGNVREMMGKEVVLPLFNSTTPPSPAAALPAITFPDETSLHWNGETIRVFYVPHAHTDTDSIIHFQSSNVIQMGDTLWTNGYPRIDAGDGGGSLEGVIAAIEVALTLADDDTIFIPGHGDLPPRGTAFVETYLAMLQTIFSRVDAMVESGMSEDEVVAARPTAEFDDAWGAGYIGPDLFARIAYISMQEN